jgi:dephospho-CoA kinase
LEELGFHIIDCDALYHHLLKTDEQMLAAIESLFPGVVENGVLQRKKLGQQVFGNAEALAQLNRTVWPYVNQSVDAILQEKAPQPCAIDAIGLLESGLAEYCTHTVAITAPEELRVARLMSREGISEEYARLRIRAQKSNEVFAAACGMTIENHDTCAEEFQSHCKAIFQTLCNKEDPLNE